MIKQISVDVLGFEISIEEGDDNELFEQISLKTRQTIFDL